jgi:hypothetical protein
VSAGLEGRCFRRRKAYGGHVQRPGSRKRLPSKDFDQDSEEHEDEVKILAKMSELPAEDAVGSHRQQC